MQSKDTRRLVFIYISFSLLFFFLALRISYLQLFKRNFFSHLAKSQHTRIISIKGKRGRIFDAKGRLLADNVVFYSLFADPSKISSPRKYAQLLSEKIDIDKDTLYKKLIKRNKKFVWIKRKVSLSKKKEIEKLNLGGIGFIREEKRVYPEDKLAAHILGYTDIDNNGIDGIELIYDKYLKGKEALLQISKDAAGNLSVPPDIISLPSGADIALTVDAYLQYWVEEYLKETVQDTKAKDGSVIVMDAYSGAILALANYPSFDPNNIDRDRGPLRNIAICDIFEPGSVFKALTLVAALAEGNFQGEEEIFCEQGRFKIPGSILHDWHPFGKLTFKEVFLNSSNIGVAKIAQKIFLKSKNILYNYARKMGFGEKTGIDLPGEARGILKPTKEWSKTSFYVFPIGQEIGVTLVQLVRFFAVIANGGKLVSPHLLKKISFVNNAPITHFSVREGRNFLFPSVEKVFSYPSRRVISQKLAQKAQKILIEVVEKGTGRRAAIPGVIIGGKTGTAQKYDKILRRYSPTRYRASFVGFMKTKKGAIVIGVSIDEPKTQHYGGMVAAPLFKKIALKINEIKEDFSLVRR